MISKYCTKSSDKLKDALEDIRTVYDIENMDYPDLEIYILKISKLLIIGGKFRDMEYEDIRDTIIYVMNDPHINLSTKELYVHLHNLFGEPYV